MGYRRLFPDQCFREMRYPVRADINYEEFATGQLKEKHPADSDRTRLQILHRCHNKAADQLLQWLQEGVFDALQQRVLRGIQLNIHNSHDAVIESYTFSLSYGDPSAPPSVTFTGSQGKAITVKGVQHSLHSFLRNLGFSVGYLPHLPSASCSQSANL